MQPPADQITQQHNMQQLIQQPTQPPTDQIMQQHNMQQLIQQPKVMDTIIYTHLMWINTSGKTLGAFHAMRLVFILHRILQSGTSSG